MDEFKIWDITESCEDQSIYYISHGRDYSKLLVDLKDVIMAWADEEVLSKETKKYVRELLKKTTMNKSELEAISICDEFELSVSKIYEGSEGATAYLEQFLDNLDDEEEVDNIDLDVIHEAIKNGCVDQTLVMRAVDEIGNYFDIISSFRRISI